MNLSKPLALIYLLAASLIILCSSARAQEAPSGANNKKPPAGEGRGQKKPDKCEISSPIVRNWELIGRDYVFFDYVLMLRSERLRIKFDKFGISCLQSRQIDL